MGGRDAYYCDMDVGPSGWKHHGYEQLTKISGHEREPVDAIINNEQETG